MTKSIKQNWNDPYPTLVDGWGALGDEVNKRIAQYWQDTGQVLDIDHTIINVLIDDYNERHTNPDKVKEGQ